MSLSRIDFTHIHLERFFCVPNGRDNNLIPTSSVHYKVDGMTVAKDHFGPGSKPVSFSH